MAQEVENDWTGAQLMREGRAVRREVESGDDRFQKGGRETITGTHLFGWMRGIARGAYCCDSLFDRSRARRVQARVRGQFQRIS